MIDLIFDILRVAHMSFFAAGIGTAAFLELSVVKRFRERIDLDGLRLVLTGHELIRVTVIGLWTTGLTLIFFRLVVFQDPFTAKLATKLIVVSALTLNMVVIEQYLIPTIFEYEGERIADMPLSTILLVGATVGFSGGVWTSALLLGGISQFRSMAFSELLMFFLPLLAIALLLGCMAALIAGRSGCIDQGTVSNPGRRARLLDQRNVARFPKGI